MSTRTRHLFTAFCAGAVLFAAAASRGDSISFTESWKDTAQPDGGGGFNVLSQDTASFHGTFTVPGLGAVSAGELGNISITISFGSGSSSWLMSDADVGAGNSATFFVFSENNDTGDEVKIGQVKFTRTGNTLTIAGQAQNSLAVMPQPLLADQYSGNAGPIHDEQTFSITISGPVNYSLDRTLYISGTSSVKEDSAGDPLSTVQISGSADFAAPSLTFVSPKNGARLGSNTVTVVARAMDKNLVQDVEFWIGDGDPQTGDDLGSNLWSADFELAPGTNFIRAFAVDAAGNVSATNLLRLVYVVSAPIQLNVVGRGSISGATDGQLLEIGKRVVLRAAPAPRSGFGFTSWTDGDGNVVTNKPVLTFLMESNLVFTANFADIQRPICIITNPTVNKRWSNEVFTASGKASDNAGVAAVYFKFNSDDWAPATTSNNWTNWTAANLVLTPGTNYLSVYAVDAAGNVSLTNTVRFFYVLSDVLTVFVDGSGTIAPNLNGKALGLGKSYSMTARPGKGFKFLNWTGAGGVVTTAAKVTFVMESNLWFSANFQDIGRPVNAILSPKVNQTVADSAPVATGKATDNVGVTEVWFQVNGGSWTMATLLDGTNWSTPSLASMLFAGANSISAFAVDAAGNRSLTNTVRFKYTVTPVSDFAPDSLNGTLVLVTPDGGSPVSVGFDPATFTQASSTNNNNSDDWGAGTYEYVKTDTNTAELSLGFATPPNRTNDMMSPVSLVFTSHYAGYFTNADGSGGFTVTIPTLTIPTSLAGKTLIAVDDEGTGTNTVKFMNGTAFTSVKKGSSGIHNSSGTYTLTRLSPVGAMAVFTFTNPGEVGRMVYVQLLFTNNTAGQFMATRFDEVGTYLDNGVGRFIVK